MLLALAVFVAAYALLAIPSLPRLMRRLAPATGRRARVLSAALTRPGIALSGAALVVLVGALTPRAALLAIDLRTLALLSGMMLLVAGLELSGAFAWLATMLARRFATPRKLLVASMVTVAVLSALVLNDAVVLLFTPVLVRAARSMGVNVFPFLAGEAFAANLGSAATPVGNPQNAAIALASGIPFTTFAAALAPIALAGLAIGIVVCLVAFRRELSAAPTLTVALDAPPLRPRILVATVSCIAVALFLFVYGPTWGIPLWAAALIGGLLLVAFVPFMGASLRGLGRGVDVGILVFFVGLFVLLRAVADSDALRMGLAFVTDGTLTSLTLGVAALSNVVSNVPAVLLVLPHIATDADALRLAAVSTFAGNATFLGSAATVIVAETARRHGADFDVLRFTLVGLVLTALTLGLSMVAL